MSEEHKPKHLRNIPPGVNLSPDEERELMDLRTEVERRRRRRASEKGADAPEPWDFPVAHPMARLFDRLPSPFTQQEAVAEGKSLGMDAVDVAEALRQMRAHELVSDALDGYVKHPEAKNWF